MVVPTCLLSETGLCTFCSTDMEHYNRSNVAKTESFRISEHNIFLLQPFVHQQIRKPVCGQWAIKNNCQNDSSLIIFTMRDISHWNYVTSQNIPYFNKAWKILSIYVFCNLHFFRLILTPRKLISGTAGRPQNGLCDRSPWRIRDG